MLHCNIGNGKTAHDARDNLSRELGSPLIPLALLSLLTANN